MSRFGFLKFNFAFFVAVRVIQKCPLSRVQIDCRDHDWFESRAQACTALVCVDYEPVSLKQADGR